MRVEEKVQGQLAITVPLVGIKLKILRDFDQLVSFSTRIHREMLCEFVTWRVSFVIGSLDINAKMR